MNTIFYFQPTHHHGWKFTNKSKKLTETQEHGHKAIEEDMGKIVYVYLDWYEDNKLINKTRCLHARQLQKCIKCIHPSIKKTFQTSTTGR